MRKLNLGKPSQFENGISVELFSTKDFDFVSEVTRLLLERGFITKEVPLTELHKEILPESQVPDEYGINQITRSFYETSPKFIQIYKDFIRHLAENVLKTDVLYQKTPTMRFHFPVPFHDIYRAADGSYLAYHSDTMLGHPFEEINCWIPFTKCEGSATLLIAPIEISISLLEEFVRDFDGDADIYHTRGQKIFFKRLMEDEAFRRKVIDACQPKSMEFGQALVFDPRCIHGPSENSEATTRISIDFRMIPTDIYDSIEFNYSSQGSSKRKFARGEIYSEEGILKSSSR